MYVLLVASREKIVHISYILYQEFICCSAESPQNVLLYIILATCAGVFPAIIISFMSLFSKDFGHITKLKLQ